MKTVNRLQAEWGDSVIRLENVYFNDFVPNWRKSQMITDMYVLLFVTQGKFNFSFDQAAYTISKGDVVLIRPGVVRSGSDGTYPPHQKFAVHFHLEPSSIPMLAPTEASGGFKLFKTHKAEYLRQHFHQLYQAWIDKNMYYEFICHGIMTGIFGTVLQELAQQNISSSKLIVAKRLESYILEHYKEEITIAQMAELVQLSPNYVISIFKEVTKQTPMEFVHQVRISIARNLLLNSDMNIAEVSDHLGFCDPTYFNRVFKKVLGVPPSTLLKQRKMMKA
jgi:AraC-like DNA-binding protein